MITDNWLIENGFEYKIYEDGAFWFIKIQAKDEFWFEDVIYQVSEDRSIVQHYDGLDVYNLSDAEFVKRVESLSKSK